MPTPGQSYRIRVDVTGDETPEQLRAMSAVLKDRVVEALAKMGVPIEPSDVTVVRHGDRYTNAGELIGSITYHTPTAETRAVLTEAFEDGQRAGHEYGRVLDGHPSRYRMLPKIKTSPYGEDVETDDPAMGRCLHAAWSAGFELGRKYEESWPGTGIHSPY